MYTVVEVLELAERVCGVPAPRRRASPRVVRALANTSQILGALLPLPPMYRHESLRVIAGTTYGGTSAKAEKELGWTARSLEECLPEMLLDCMRELGMQPPPSTR